MRCAIGRGSQGYGETERTEPATSQTGWDCVRPDNRAHFSGFSPSIREVRVDKIVHAHTVRPLFPDKPEKQWSGPHQIRLQKVDAKRCWWVARSCCYLSSEFLRGDLKLERYCGSGPLELRSVSLPIWPHAKGRRTFIDMIRTIGTMTR